eukprot:maker-scaffold140_size315649-snap-gene-0.13 protein:Tk03572 transcript:maker-scaffold140_size315649-snap-gene-0.13-mRNA-1 annotation:"lim and sh3 domain protein lasp-like"
MSKKCAKCEKTVYPTEELKCLEKVWHKACFKCQTCNMTLSMRNYQGFGKLPYCGAHVPKAKATIVSDTPEMKRLAENSKNQSTVKYHADFEASKGKFTQIADDPEILRIKANSQTISNVSYHGVVEQKAAQEKKRSLVEGQTGAPIISSQTPARDLASDSSAPTIHSTPPNHGRMEPPRGPPANGRHAQPDYRKMSLNDDSTSQRMPVGPASAGGHPSGRHSQPAMVASYTHQHSIQARSQPLPPSNGGPAPGYYQQQTPHSNQVPHGQTQTNFRHPSSAPSQPQQRPSVRGRCFQAMYDYEAQDVDEVSFKDGDVVVNCTPIDEGWMTGTVHRTGKYGMLPANYVEPVNI